ncbi:ATP-dependent helicase HrpB [Corallococcus interemptor]|uniref:ATP-dependent helicase HrpB n=1 Tax=Corallococcus interemptor TaxID=2316720 RepID=A0A3A8PQ62_9BACT|nr:ATP-dependent helicase HrpB [Corallococcus interemptor]RKH39188.1 ATP-dependent helicase HrpB [Corallococcus sp. AB050B]RKH58473.1 ATP-dependent helicase HrpB [Corallococcus interemptor]
MAIDKLGAVGGAGPSPAVESGRETFGKVLEGVSRPASRPVPVTTEGPPKPVRTPGEAPAGTSRADGVERAKAGCAEVKPGARVDSVQAARGQQAVEMLDRVGQAQQRLDHILKLAESGRTFTPAELLALQAHVYRASQELDLAGKVVEKATGGVKQVLQTQV